MAKHKHIIAVVGPTAVGKTHTAIALAEHFGTDILSADSRQLYKDLHIGTARPSDTELARVHHHLVGELPLERAYSAGDYERDALRILRALFRTNDVVVLAGGTGFYVQALEKGMAQLPTISPKTRAEVGAEIAENGHWSLYDELKATDPEAYANLDLANPRRVQRAIEVIRTTGKPYSSFKAHKPKERDFTVHKIGLNIERAELHERINRRVEAMIEQGLINEVKALQARGYTPALKSLQSIGYQEVFRYLAGEMTLEEAIEKIKINSRRYARRQLTWFRRDKSVTWFSPEDTRAIIAHADTCISQTPD